MGKAARPQGQLRSPAVSRTGSWMLVFSAVTMVVSLLLPWFSSRVSITYIQYYGFELGLPLFCTMIVVVSIGIGLWCSWIGRGRLSSMVLAQRVGSDGHIRRIRSSAVIERKSCGIYSRSNRHRGC